MKFKFTPENNLNNKFLKQVQNQVQELIPVWNLDWNQASAQVWDQVETLVRSQVQSQVRDQLQSYEFE